MFWLVLGGWNLLFGHCGASTYGAVESRIALTTKVWRREGESAIPPLFTRLIPPSLSRLHPQYLVLCFLEDTIWLPRPRVSAALSALLPGAGQMYNRSYWKAPIVWGLLGITGYLAYRNHREYLFYRRAYQEALAGGDPLPPLRPENIRALRESYRQDRDVFLLAFLVGYGLQIGEAYADAHLKGFTIYGGLAPAGVFLALLW